MSDISSIQELFREEFKLDIDSLSNDFLEKSLIERMNEKNLSSVADYITILKESRKEAETLYYSLFISYTEFFRNPLTFGFLERVILPKLIIQEKSLRIWSAGCSAGQEAFSVAFILNDFFKVRKSSCNWTIFATDISSDLVETAQKGEYSYEALENVSLKHFDQYFIKKGNRYIIKNEIRERIIFSTYDLRDGNSTSPPQSIYGDFDIIICSNVLLYYNNIVQSVLLEKFHKALADPGYLIVGEDETGLIRGNSFFLPVFSSSPVYFKH